MPALRPPTREEYVPLPPRRARLAAQTDVLVVGGGPAGLGAAVGAAQAGARVVLVERYGFLGGNATAALVMPLMSFHTHGPPPQAGDSASLVPIDHGPGVPVVGGVLAAFLDRLSRAGGSVPPSPQTGYVVAFDPEVFKSVALDLLDDAGVEYLFHAFATDVVDGDPAQGVVLATKSGPLVVRAKAVVDATGDGDVAALAGAPCDVGRDEDGLVQPVTLMFRMVEFEHAAFAAYVRDHPGEWHGVHGLWDLVRRATAAGELELPRDDVLLFATPHAGEVSVNSTRLAGVLGTSAWDLTRAESECRRQMRQITAFLVRWVPGFEGAYAAQSGVQVGIRETRRVRGRHRLTAQDVLGARKFPDAVACSAYPIDIHDPAGTGTLLRHLPPGEAYEIPLGCLLPDGVDHLLVAGRCISGSHEALSSYRVTPVCMATGHAAGICAALAAARGRTPREVRVADVQRELRRQGAILLSPPDDDGGDRAVSSRRRGPG